MLTESITLEPGEEILKVVRKHWLVITAELVGVALSAILPLILISLGFNLSEQFGNSVAMEASAIPIMQFAAATWLLLSVLGGFVVWTHYYLDLWVITDRRIIAVKQIHFFNRSVAIFRLERLQDIEFKISGLIETFFNFGTISAQTAGHMEANFVSSAMPNPDQLQNIIQKAMDARLAELNNRPNLAGSEIL